MEIKKSVRPVLENIIAQYIPVAAGGAVLILAWLSRQLSMWQMFLLFLGLSVLVIFAINQISILRERRRLGNQSIERSGKVIRDWLDGTRLNVANDPIDLAYYRYTVTLGLKKVSIFRPKDDPEFVHLGITLHVLPNDYIALDGITASPKSTLIKDLRIELLKLGLEITGLNHPLRTISLSDSIVFDQYLTRLAFYKRILLMFCAQVILGELITAEARRNNVSLAMDIGLQSNPPSVSRKEGSQT